MRRLHAKVYGRVQGVYFRATTQRTANSLNVNGWVRNNPDGTVEVVAEGDKDALEQMLQFLQEGSPSAQVQRVDDTWQKATGTFDNFAIRG